MKNKNAYITLADTEQHLRCAYALALSLNRVKSLYPLYIMIPRNSVNYENFPQVENTKIIEIPLLMFNGIDATGDFNTTINKFFCLQYEEFDKVIFFDADVFVQSNIDYLFEEKFPIILTENNEIRGEMFGLKTDIELLSLIINLVIRFNFSTDEQILTYLFNKHFLPIGSTSNKCRTWYHDAGQPKMWAAYNYMEIKNMIDNNEFDFNIQKDFISNVKLQKQYLSQITKRIRKKYETI